jgi:phytoene dehydrogenase-like protein
MAHETQVGRAIKHGLYHPFQMGIFCPHDSCGGGRTPIEGSYLGGASSYPGGLVIGGLGYIAANSIADDIGMTRWWKPSREIARYEELYLP